MENKEAKSPQHSDRRKQPGPVPSFLASFDRAYSKLGSSRAKTAQSQEKPASLPQHLADIQELEQLYSPISRLYQQINNTHPGKFSLPFADGLCNELDCVLDDLLSQAKSKELLAVIHDLTLARNEVMLTVDYLDLEGVHPLYRLVLRNKAILRLKDVLHGILRN
jgi:hypothetical protein